MTVSNLGGWYMALSTDVVDGKLSGVSRIGAPIYFTDTFEWKQVGEGQVIHDFYGFPMQIMYPIESNGGIPVSVQDQTSQTVDLYLMNIEVSPSITSAISSDDTTIAIDDNTGVIDGHAICLKEGVNFFQSVVKSSTANEIVLSSPIDADFTTSATLTVGAWNLAVDGSTETKTFFIQPPSGLDFDIYGITISGLDDLSMDSTTFIGIVDGISNGLVLRHANGNSKNIGLFVNNLGLEEQRYTVDYKPANKHSEYGIVAKKNFKTENGVAIRLTGADGDKIEALVRDDLSSQSLIAIVMHGHVVTG